MTNRKLEVDVARYEQEACEKMDTWKHDGCIRLRLIESDYSHPAAIEIFNPDGFGSEVVPANDLIKAVEWIKRCLS